MTSINIPMWQSQGWNNEVTYHVFKLLLELCESADCPFYWHDKAEEVLTNHAGNEEDSVAFLTCEMRDVLKRGLLDRGDDIFSGVFLWLIDGKHIDFEQLAEHFLEEVIYDQEYEISDLAYDYFYEHGEF